MAGKTAPTSSMDASTLPEQPAFQLIPPSRPLSSVVEDARAGLLRAPRGIPPKYFYDERGSVLFDRICDTPEYYPTRTEQALLESASREIVGMVMPDHLFELGSGTSRKTRTILDACAGLRVHPDYWPFDVSEEILLESSAALAREYPWLEVKVLVGDYGGGLDKLPPLPGRELALFLGGTIGNFTEAAGAAFLRELARHLDDDDYLTIGLDRIKDVGVLEAAYNDAQGLTAEFNLNMLNVLNRELDADFRIDAFEHLALFNEEQSRIEMYLVAKRPQTVRLGALGETLRLDGGERILTEISRKFSGRDIGELLSAGGFREVKRFDAPDEWYSLVLAAKR